MTTTIAPPRPVEEVKKKLIHVVSKNWNTFNKAFAIWDKNAKIENPNSEQVIAIIILAFPEFEGKDAKKILKLGYYAWRTYIKTILTIK